MGHQSYFLPVVTVPFDLFQLVASKCGLMLPVAGFKVRGSGWHCCSSILATLRDGSDGILNVVLWYNPPRASKARDIFSSSEEETDFLLCPLPQKQDGGRRG